jgi:metallo-beta-lactamase family protein
MSAAQKTTLHFFGGAGSVTGANFMLESEGVRILVDCGLFQGCDFCEAANYEPFPYDPKSIDVLLVTHAHIDHVGRIPRLVREGFRGKIISTAATKGLAAFLLKDSMELLAHDAKKKGKEPLYDEGDVTTALSVWETHPYYESVTLPGGFSAEFLNAEHILGSAMIQISRAGRSILFSGDLGNDYSLLVGPLDTPKSPNYMLTESVYGDKKNTDNDVRTDLLERTIESTIARGGTLLIPAFSTERTQDLIYEIRHLMKESKVPPVPVFVDSPLATEITEVFHAYPEYLRPEIAARVTAGEDIFSFSQLRFVSSPEESRRLLDNPEPKIIIAGSGMSHGGRVLAHEAHLLPDPNSTLLIVGYQAAGSLGRQLMEGARSVRIHEDTVPVRAAIETNFGYSAHRDMDGLTEFVHRSMASLEKVFVVMGEPASSGFLTQHLRDYLGTDAIAPQAGEQAALDL